MRRDFLVKVFVSAICHDGNGKLLLGKRGGEARDRHGQWEFGGGALEEGETLEEALRRETKEEFGAELYDIQQVGVSEFDRSSGKWLGIFYVARVNPHEVNILEPVYDEIGWFSIEDLPEPMFEDALKFAQQAHLLIQS